MKKKTEKRKLVLAKETVRALVDAGLVVGGTGATDTSCRPNYCPREASLGTCNCL